MSKNNQNEFPITSQEKIDAHREAKNKEKNEDSSGVDKQKVARRRKKGSIEDPKMTQAPKGHEESMTSTHRKGPEKHDPIDESKAQVVEPITKTKKKIPRISKTDKSQSLNVGGPVSTQTVSHASQTQKSRKASPKSLLDPSMAKSTPSMNKAESFEECTEVPYQTLEGRPKISLAVIGPSTTTLSDDASDSQNPSDLTDPLDAYNPTRYENNSSYAAAIKGGMSFSQSETCKGALDTLSSCSIGGSNESLKFDRSQFDDNTLRSMSIASASPKMVTKLGNTSPLLSGHSNIPMITTNPPRKDYPQSRLSPVSPARSLRKYSQGSRFSRQQSQPSPKDNRYHCRGIRRSISNKITAEEEAMLRHVCSFSAIDNHGKSNYCHHMHQCCSLHNCGNTSDPLHGKEGHGEPGVFSCNYLHVQNDPNAACHHGQTPSRICRNMGCREASTHVIGSGMCLGLDPDSIANIAFDSMKFKGATKKFNQVRLDSFYINHCIQL